ncbi:mitochondrial ribosomal protein subunit L20-domain-containing protein [Lipomyces japonicus]|uniref:mitochondrial 54S ribosomal protein mL58 n=1 Tax=Lipomyces japonicus TaxID=56871 RepID=UPI0034CD4039
MVSLRTNSQIMTNVSSQLRLARHHQFRLAQTASFSSCSSAFWQAATEQENESKIKNNTKIRTTRFKDPAKFNTPFPTKFNPISSANKARPILPPGLTYNPPPSAPSPFDTPDIFLPVSERIKVATDASLPVLPPPLGPISTKQYHLTEVEVEEIKRLRATDPENNSITSLAKRFNCSYFFIIMVSRVPESRKLYLQGKARLARLEQSEVKRHAIAERLKRRQSWRRDE